MKRMLAMALALILTFSMGMVTFAEQAYTASISVEEIPYIYRAGEMIQASEYEPGKTYYFPIINEDFEYHDGEPNIETTSALKNYTIKQKIYSGKSVLKEVRFSQKLLDYPMDRLTEGKAVFLAITFADTIKSTDIDYTFTITGKTGSPAEGDEWDVNVVDILEDSNSSNDDDVIYVDYRADEVDFTDYEGRVCLEFGGGAAFYVTMHGQDDLDFEYTNTTAGTSCYKIVEKYPQTNMRFHLFQGRGTSRTFDNTGKLYLPADEGSYLYEVSGDTVRGIEASYSRIDGCFIVSTKRLGYYVVTDKQLGSIATSSTKNPLSSAAAGGSSANSGDAIVDNGTTPDNANDTTVIIDNSTTASNNTLPSGQVVNPNTGANDLVGVAMALGVVSVATIGAVCFQKNTK